MKFDAIILAGDKGASYRFKGNKACLKIKGVPIINYILRALDQVEEVDNVYLIGPKEILEKNIKTDSKKLKKIFEQGESLLENIWKVFLAITPEDKMDRQNPQAILFLPGDIPLVTPEEISYFLKQCDLSQGDFFVGLTPEENLNRFHPTNQDPGMKLAYFHFKEKRYRINNLYLAKPLLLSDKKDYLQKVYDYRYQKKLKNILCLSWELLKINGGIPLLKYYILAQISLFLSHLHLKKLSAFFRSYCPLSAVEKFISDFLNVRYIGVNVYFGGAALDIDNETDYKIIETMYEPWQKYLRNSVPDDKT